MSLKDWIQAPTEWGDWGTRFNAWMKDLTIDQAAQDDRIVVLESNVRTTPDTHEILTSDIFTGNFLLNSTTHAPPTARRDESGLVTWDGLVVNNTGGVLPIGTQVAVVRAGYRPTTRELVVPVASSVAGMWVRVPPGGLVTTGVALPVGGFISLSWTYRI